MVCGILAEHAIELFAQCFLLAGELQLVRPSNASRSENAPQLGMASLAVAIPLDTDTSQRCTLLTTNLTQQRIRTCTQAEMSIFGHPLRVYQLKGTLQISIFLHFTDSILGTTFVTARDQHKNYVLNNQ